MRTLLELAQAVKRGVALLDRKIPNWRTVIRKHKDEFDFANGSCCVLGTLEHYSGRMAVLKKRKTYNWDMNTYERAVEALRLRGADNAHGFDANEDGDYDNYEVEIEQLDALWRAEIGLDA